MIFSCPNCNREINHLNYNQGVTEYGHVTLPDSDDILDCSDSEHIEDIMDELEDQEDDRDYGDHEYRCPACEDYISIDDLIRQAERFYNESGNEGEEDGTPIEEEETDCTSERVNIEQKFVSASTGYKSRTYFCDECLHESIIDMEEDLNECPCCGHKTNNK